MVEISPLMVWHYILAEQHWQEISVLAFTAPDAYFSISFLHFSITFTSPHAYFSISSSIPLLLSHTHMPISPFLLQFLFFSISSSIHRLLSLPWMPISHPNPPSLFTFPWKDQTKMSSTLGGFKITLSHQAGQQMEKIGNLRQLEKAMVVKWHESKRPKGKWAIKVFRSDNQN